MAQHRGATPQARAELARLLELQLGRKQRLLDEVDAACAAAADAISEIEANPRRDRDLPGDARDGTGVLSADGVGAGDAPSRPATSMPAHQRHGDAPSDTAVDCCAPAADSAASAARPRDDALARAMSLLDAVAAEHSHTGTST